VDSAEAPGGDTVFEIGSITKVFTGTILADMVREGLVKLDDPVAQYLPAELVLGDPRMRVITLLDLATHRSGLPRLPGNLWTDEEKRAGVDTTNPYAQYTVARLYAFLSGYTLPRAPGAQSEYSNLGFGLLGHALALKTGKTYEDLVVERVCAPLGMKDTRITLDADQRARLAQGYKAFAEVDGARVAQPSSNWDIPTLAGAGALRSTVNDMLKFLKANLGLTETRLAEAFQQARAPRCDEGKHRHIGLGWVILSDANQEIGVPGVSDKDHSLTVVWHNGETGGYYSYLGFVPERAAGVVVLSNTASSTDTQARELLVKLAEIAAPPAL